MRWALILLVVGAAGAGAWWWSQQSDAPSDDMEYFFDVNSDGQITSRPLTRGIQGSGIDPLGIIGEAARPREHLGEPDRWMAGQLDLPSQEMVSGKDVLKAMSKLAPIRFRSHAEMARFEQGEFALGSEDGNAVHAHVFEGLASDMGFRVEVKNEFLFVYDPDGNDAFKKMLLEKRKKGERRPMQHDEEDG